MSKQYTPGPTVIAAELVIGDVIFARRDRHTKQPSYPSMVTHITPSRISDKLLVTVQSVHDVQSPWPLGWMPPTRELVRAVPVEV